MLGPGWKERTQGIVGEGKQGLFKKDFPFLVKLLWHLCQKSSDHIAVGFISAIYSPAIYMPIFSSIPHCPDSYIFIVSLAIRELSPPTLFFL